MSNWLINWHANWLSKPLFGCFFFLRGLPNDYELIAFVSWSVAILKSHREDHLHLIYGLTDINRNFGWHDKQSIWITIKFFLLPNQKFCLRKNPLMSWRKTGSVNWPADLQNSDRSSYFWFRSFDADWFSGKPFNIASWPWHDQIMMCKVIECVREMDWLTAEIWPNWKSGWYKYIHLKLDRIHITCSDCHFILRFIWLWWLAASRFLA